MSILSAVMGIEIGALWAIIAVLFLIIEVIFISGFFLPFSASAGIVALKIYILESSDRSSDIWNIFLFAVVGVAFILPFRLVLRRFFDRTKDINDF